MKISLKIPSLLKKINLKNLDSGLESFGKFMDSFSKGIDEFGKSMDAMTKELGGDQSNRKSEEKKNQDNLKKIFGNSDVKIWSDK